MRIIKSNITWVLLLFAGFITSCEKTEIKYEPNRQTIVKIKDAENDVTQKARDVLPTIDEFILIDLRRDPTQSADLNQPLTVKLVKDVALITAYNTANGTTFIELPAASYTLSDDVSNITFQPGEVVKEVKITVNKASLSLSQQYALAFKITEVGSGAVISNSFKEAIYSIGIKNKYDGKYRVTGTFVDVTNPLFVGTYPHEWDLVTAGPNTVLVVDNINFGFPAYAFNSLGDPTAPNTGYGSFGLVVSFDASDNLSMYNYYGDPTRPATSFGNPAGGSGPPNYAASNTRRAVVDPSGINKYNAATKQVDVKYFLVQPSVIATPPHVRAMFNEQWKYIGPR
jgi:hypothetical protein